MGYVLDFSEIDRTQVALVGGKGANLAELSRVDGIRVPDGFCVTTDAFRLVVAEVPAIDGLLDRLSRLTADDQVGIREVSAQLRRGIEHCAIPEQLAAEITRSVARLGAHHAYAVRSSATAEDLPTASFAGQQDSYLNIRGAAAILRQISRCWGSLFTERAVTYRLRNGFDQRTVRMAVVVQRMVFPRASGVLVTADPRTGNRKDSCVDAGFGLGEALVSGLVNADAYTVRAGKVTARTIATKEVAVQTAPGGGTQTQTIAPQHRNQPVLTDAQVVRLAELGRTIETRFGCPQDIEWCLDSEDFRIVQSRPITTLFPIPTAEDDEYRIYLSVGHQQMMTDPIKPLGISLWQLTSQAPMRTAGARLFVDATRMLMSPASRAGIVSGFTKSDPLTGDALRTALERAEFPESSTDEIVSGAPDGDTADLIDPDPDLVTELIAVAQTSLATLQRDIRTVSGPALLDFIRADIQELRRAALNPDGRPVYLTAMAASSWLNDQLDAWLGEKNAADTLTRSVPHNVTSAMGLALLDVADVIRPYPEVVDFLRSVDHAEFDDARFLPELANRTGGPEARAAIEEYLDEYGMRCVGEIDITRPRWSEHPTMLVPTILHNIENFEPGAGARRFELGRREAQQKELELLERLRALPDGEHKAGETKRMIDRVRTFAGYREYPKYAMVNRYYVYKQALLREADRLVQARVIHRPDDIFYLRFDELHELVRSHQPCAELVQERKTEFRAYQALTPPRVLTSDGEIFTGAYRRTDVPAGALAGMGVSAGTVEGRARVVLDMAQADLAAGDILVTSHTDPSWTPLFVAITGLVTEVGGLMTHGAVIAREYGLPAVVGVQQATQMIRDGQRIRVHGTDGYVEVLTQQAG